MKVESVRNGDRTGIIDTAIVGAGPAGLSAALFLARAGRSVVAFDGGPSRIVSVDRVREFIGYDGMSPRKMLARMRAEAVGYGAQTQEKGILSSSGARRYGAGASFARVVQKRAPLEPWSGRSCDG